MVRCTISLGNKLPLSDIYLYSLPSVFPRQGAVICIPKSLETTQALVGMRLNPTGSFHLFTLLTPASGHQLICPWKAEERLKI